MKSNTKHCTNCGSKMNISSRNCTNCGAINEVDPVKVLKVCGEKVNYAANVVKKVSRKTIETLKESEQLSIFSEIFYRLKDKGIFKKKNLIKLGLSIVTISLLFSFATKEETKTEVVENLQNAIIDNDINEIKKIIKSSDKRLEIDKNIIKILLSYYEENPSRLNSDMDDLLQNNNDYIPYRFETRKGLFKEKNVVILQPRYIVIDGEADNIEIQIKHKDKIVKTVNKYGEIGPLSPGVYTIDATFKNDYVKRSESKDIDIFSTSQNNMTLFNDVNTISIKSNKPEAILYIDGKSTNKKIKDIKSIVGLEDDTKLQAVLKNGRSMLKSNVEEVYDDGNYNLNFEEITDENIEDIMKTFIENYENAYEDAINEADFTLVSEYLLDGSAAYDEYKGNIDLFREKNIKRSSCSWYIEDISQIDDNKYKVVVNEEIEIDRDGDYEYQEIILTCTVEVIDGSLYITSVTED